MELKFTGNSSRIGVTLPGLHTSQTQKMSGEARIGMTCARDQVTTSTRKTNRRVEKHEVCCFHA